MNSRTNTINREASDKTKGFRLQKLRAIKLMLKTLECQNNTFFYTAIEDVEDVSHTKLTSSDEPSTYYEEDKNYDENHNFTIFSPEVTNTLVSFFDIYVHSWKSSDEVLLGFYTTASIGKERKKFLVDGIEVSAPDDPILKTISADSELSDNIVKMVKFVVLNEYRVQYSSKDMKGNLETLEKTEINDFRRFLEKINWQFEGEDDKLLKNTVIQLIKESKYYNIRHEGKEEAIFSILMEFLDQRQNNKYLTSRVVTASDVKYVFLQAESEESDLLMDPVWENLESLEKEITDKRNLEEKIFSVCPEYTQKKIKHLARLACRSKREQLSNNKSFLSLKYRTFEACSEYFFNNSGEVSTEFEIDHIIEELKNISNKQIEELKKDYTYSVSNGLAVNGVIMDLFDSCFLSFDEAKKDE